MRQPIFRRPRVATRNVETPPGSVELLGNHVQELFMAPSVEQVLQSCLLAVGAVAVLEKNTHYRCGYCDTFARRNEDATLFSEIFVPCDAAKR